MMVNEAIQKWKQSSKYYKCQHKIFYQDINPEALDTILILHGYPTCSFDYFHVIDQLSVNHRLIIPDFLGFGLSEKPPGHSYLLTEQAKIISNLIESLNIQSLHIVAHDYGTSVCTEIVALDLESKLPFAVRHITLCNGSMLIHMSQLRTIQKLLKNKFTGPIIALLSNEKTFHRNMKNIWKDPSKYDRNHMQIHWEMLISDNGKSRLPAITRYINQRYENYDRWIGALKSTGLPIHILWAENDPVAVIDMAYELENIIPKNYLTTIPNCGHYPMIELPETWAHHVLSQLE